MLTEEQKRKISMAKTGKTRPPFSDEWLANISKGLKGKNTWSKGRPLSEEHRRKIGLSLLGGKRSEDTKQKMSDNSWMKTHAGDKAPQWKGGKDGDTSINLENRRKYRKQREMTHPEISKYYGMAARARALSIPMDIDRRQFTEWFDNEPKVCAYCGRDISARTDSRMTNLSVDRKYNEVGYVIGNICLACNRCNTVKGNVFTYDQMKEIADKYLREKITSA